MTMSIWNLISEFLMFRWLFGKPDRTALRRDISDHPDRYHRDFDYGDSDYSGDDLDHYQSMASYDDFIDDQDDFDSPDTFDTYDTYNTFDTYDTYDPTDNDF